ncbi:MAG: 16S rRNA (guanine(966)-N(2))-methyltransferase RsmD [Bacilli bacterium]|nr:16S rRNA (guanine(966)-N(2))-methyltransferase RsmD [Bacilli bacterium]
MRIITGKHKGRKLFTLEGKNTRPMMDRMKESIFNIIGPYFDGDIVLDLFGGSGALSIESISRGASRAEIVEKHPDAIKIIKKNIELVKEENNINLHSMDYKIALEHFKNNHMKFDLIFLDPPYRLNIIEEILEFITLNDLINHYGYIICHYQKNNHVPKELNNLKIAKHFSYGSNEVAIYEFIKP